MSKPYSYKLLPYAGPSSRITCPACGKPRCFTPYLDTQSASLLSSEYGRCDHEINCGYKRSPPKCQRGKSAGYAITSKKAEQGAFQTQQASFTGSTLSSVLTIPADVYRATLGQYEHNSLARLLRQHFGAGIADNLIARFHLGTSIYWPGATVFWLIDESGLIRGGQVVLYDATGHTVKMLRRYTCWAHTALTLAYKKRKQPLPHWLTEYAAHGQKSPCLFGLPQLINAPAQQPIALVESAKTAIMATPYSPKFIWLATMGLSYLTASRLEPLRNRHITLFPDAGAFLTWQTKADELRRSGFNIQVSERLEKLVTGDERKAGLDLADVLLREWPGYPPSWDEKELGWSGATGHRG